MLSCNVVEGSSMKIVVIGGTGLIGSKVVKRLQQLNHDVVPASPNTGVNTLTGEGLDAALEGASVVVDVSNSPSFEDAAVMEFFQTSTRNVVAAATTAGVGHYVALSVVGTERLPSSGYFRAKIAQEQLITSSAIPYTLVHATQFFEFLGPIAQSSTVGDTVHVAPVLFQPMAAEDVADAVADVSVGPPMNGRIEIAGPDRHRFDELIRDFLRSKGDQREVVADMRAPYFGAELSQDSLIPGKNPRLGQRHLQDWLAEASS
jgi:uncharacterized protein YbjT (DUF2867 family)